MTLEQLMNELRTVAPVDFPEWRKLRAEFIDKLSADDKSTLVASRFKDDE
jgi:hypothetical protein